MQKLTLNTNGYKSKLMKRQDSFNSDEPSPGQSPQDPEIDAANREPNDQNGGEPSLQFGQRRYSEHESKNQSLRLPKLYTLRENINS